MVQALRTLRNILLSVIVLGLLFTGAGVAYVKFGDRHQQPAPPAPDYQAAEPAIFAKPRKPSADAVVSASLQSLISPVSPGKNTSMSVHTLPDARCEISVKYKDITSHDSGLIPRQADAYGNVTWTWTVDAAAPAGTWPAKVTCTHNKRSAVVIGDLQVK